MAKVKQESEKAKNGETVGLGLGRCNFDEPYDDPMAT